MPIAAQTFRLQRFFPWVVTTLCLLAAIVYLRAPDRLGNLDEVSAEAWLFRALLLLAAGTGATWFAYAFTGDPTFRREEQVRFSYFFVIASFAIVTVPPFVKSQAIGSEQIGIISGCVDGAAAGQLSCLPPDEDGGTVRSDRNQWLVNIGGALRPQNPGACREVRSARCQLGSQDNRAIVSGGVVVPLPYIIIALFGGAVSLSRRVPEIQKRSELGYVPTPKEPALEAWEAREQLAFQILQFLSAPLIAIVAHQIIEPASPASAVALAFLAGFGSETILLMIRGIAEGIQPKSMTLASAAPTLAAGTMQPGQDGRTPPRDAAGNASPQIGQTTMPALETASASIRLTIDGDALDPGSLALFVNGTRTEVKDDGMAELELEVGRTYRLEASGMRGGQVVRGQLVLTATVDDEGSGHQISLA